MTHRVMQSCLSEEILRRLVEVLPPGRLRERYERQLSVSAVAAPCMTLELIQAEAELVVMEYQLKLEPKALAWLAPELRRLEHHIRQLRGRYQGRGMG